MLMAFLSSTKLVESAVLFFACARSFLRGTDRRFSAFAHNDYVGVEAERNVSSRSVIGSPFPDVVIRIQFVRRTQHDLVECAGLSQVFAGAGRINAVIGRCGHLCRICRSLLFSGCHTSHGDRHGKQSKWVSRLAEPCMRR